MADDTQLFINNFNTTISDATIGVGDTTINIPAADSALLGAIAANEYFVATLSDGSSLEVIWITANDESGALTVIRAKEGTSALSYTLADTVECRNTKGTYENFVQRDATETLTQKTLTNPTIQDENGNEQLKTSTTASAVNEITLKNAAAGNGPQLQATGDDANVDLNLVPKGTGAIKTGGALDLNSKVLKTSLGADVASATDVTLGDDGNAFDITGTTTIATIATKGVGTVVTLQFDGILQLTHSADLFLPTGANITTAAGDIAVFYEYASGDWRCVSYTRADGTPLAGSSTGPTEETVADEAEITLSTGVSGWGFAQAGDNEEWMQFSFTAAGVVTVISNSANAVNTDTDGNLCVYDAGAGIAIKNRLGASKTIRYSVNYSS